MSIQEIQPKPTIGTFIVTMILSIVLLIFFTVPKYFSMQAKARNADTAASALADMRIKSEKLQSALATLQKYKDGFARVDLAIPPKPKNPDLYALMDNLVKSTNMNATSMLISDGSSNSADTNTIGVASDLSGANSGYVLSQSGSQPAAASTTAQVSEPVSLSLSSPTLLPVDISLELSGSLDSLTQFIHILSQSLKFLELRSLETSSGNNGLNFKLGIRTYYQK